MSRLPQVNSRKVIIALAKVGFVESRQKGSHLVLINPYDNLQTLVPMHTGDIGRGLLKKILKQAKISEEQFRRLL